MSPADADGGYRWERHGCWAATALVVGGLWALLIAALVLLVAAVWIVASLGLFTLPAPVDLLCNPRAGL